MWKKAIECLSKNKGRGRDHSDRVRCVCVCVSVCPPAMVKWSLQSQGKRKTRRSRGEEGMQVGKGMKEKFKGH